MNRAAAGPYIALFAGLMALHAASSAMSAEIYKQVLPDGTVVYSDQPSPGAKKIEPPASQVIESFRPEERPVTTPVPAAKTPGLLAPFYTSLSITSPTNDEVIWDSEAPLEVAVDMEPALAREDGHSLVVLMDNQPFAESSQASRFTLSNLARGSHVLLARVEGPDGEVLIASNPVTFHVRQHSVLTRPLPPRTPTQQPPPFQPTPQRPPFQPTPQPPPFSQ